MEDSLINCCTRDTIKLAPIKNSSNFSNVTVKFDLSTSPPQLSEVFFLLAAMVFFKVDGEVPLFSTIWFVYRPQLAFLTTSSTLKSYDVMLYRILVVCP